MTTEAARRVEGNLLNLFQTLGIEQAHIAAGGPPVLTDWHGLVGASFFANRQVSDFTK
jgi:hypothetical protein